MLINLFPATKTMSRGVLHIPFTVHKTGVMVWPAHIHVSLPFLTSCISLCRNAFYEMHRIIPPRKNPGGWSSHGQPVDQLHASYRRKIRDLDVESVGMCQDLRKRPSFESLDIRPTGQVKRDVCDWEGVVKLSYQAWCLLDRRVFQAAWVVCGYVDQASMVASGHPIELPSLNEAQNLLDEQFKQYGLANTPQRCTCFEWQLQAGGVPGPC